MPSMSPASQTWGPIFIGVIFNVLLYGIMITQTYLYFTVYKKDKLWMKIFVMLLFLCDTLNCAFDIAFLYVPLVTDYGDVSQLTYATWIFATDPAMTAVIALFVQMFFAWRVYVLTNRTWAVVIIALCSIGQFCGGLGTSIAVGMVPQFTHFQSFEVIVIIWLTCSAVADTAITIALVWHLQRHKTGFSHSDDAVNKIIRLTVQTGLITALCAIVDLILFLSSPSGLHLIFNLPLSKLYTNSLMSSLNSRAGWKYGSSVGRGLNVAAVGNGGLTTTQGGVGTGSDSSTAETEERRRRGSVAKSLASMSDKGTFKKPQQVFIDVEQHEMSDRDLEMNINFNALTIDEIRTTANALDIPSVSVTTHFSGNASDSDGSTIHGVLQRDYA